MPLNSIFRRQQYWNVSQAAVTEAGAAAICAWLRSFVILLSGMGSVRALCVYILAVFLGGALLAPWLYHSAHWLAAILPTFELVAQNPFHRFVNRSLLALALIGLWPLSRHFNFRSWRELGLPWSARFWRDAGRGFLIGFGSLASVALIVVASGARNWKAGLTETQVLTHLINATAAAAIVSILEEVLFRGILFGALRRAFSWPVGLVASSAVYAWVHFFQRPASPENVAWTSGVIVLGQMMRGFLEWETLVPGFFNLMAAGMILGLAYQKYGTLHFSIGLHAGWIFWLKSYGFFSKETPDLNRWFWGTNKLIDGWIALIVLLAVLAALAMTWFRAPPHELAPKN